MAKTLLKLVNVRLSQDHLRKLDKIVRDLARQVEVPVGKTYAVRHLIDNYQTRRG